MIDKIFDLGDTTVREVMVPLVEVTMLPDTATPQEAIAVIHQRGFSRIPVYRQRQTDIVGVVAAMDLLSRGAQAASLDELKRVPYYVPCAEKYWMRLAASVGRHHSRANAGHAAWRAQLQRRCG